MKLQNEAAIKTIINLTHNSSNLICDNCKMIISAVLIYDNSASDET